MMEKASICLWVQSDSLKNPDLLSINGERIWPSDDRWVQMNFMLLNRDNFGLKIIEKRDFSIYKKGNNYTIKGVLRQCDISNRMRVFTARVKCYSLKKGISKLNIELERYHLSLSDNCCLEIRNFIKQITVAGVVTLLVVLSLIVFSIIGIVNRYMVYE